MSQHKEDENVEAFKAKIADLEKRIVELDGENQKLRQTLDEASKTLKVYVDREKDATIKAIIEKANWDKDELDKMDLPQLKLIEKAVDSAKGTVKNIRSAGAVSSTSEDENKLTVGCLYHKESA
jgi:predicted RNase H-like nuclease (RuvC/YqgF family)